MKLKRLIATAILFVAGTRIVAAQDKIYLRNGGIIDAKVREVAPQTIKYTKKDNPDGPDFIIRKGEVTSIKYANGSTDVIDPADAYNEDRRYRRERAVQDHHARFGLSNEQYGKNIISLAPIQMANEGAVGVGLHYERVIDKRNIISFYLPYALNIRRYNRYNGLNYESGRAVFNYFYPGIKVYPTGSNRRVSYAVGASAAIGFGEKYLDYYDQNRGTWQYGKRDLFKAGLLINNSLNVQPSKKVYIGLELGLGFTYYNEENDRVNSAYSDPDEPLVQFNFKVGYRF